MQRGTVENLKISPQPSPRDEAYVNKKQLTALLRGILIFKPWTCLKSGRTWDEMWVKGSSVAYSPDAVSSQIETPAPECPVGWVVQLKSPSKSKHPWGGVCVAYTSTIALVRITQYCRMRQRRCLPREFLYVLHRGFHRRFWAYPCCQCDSDLDNWLKKRMGRWLNRGFLFIYAMWCSN